MATGPPGIEDLDDYRGQSGTNVKPGDPSEWATCQTGLVLAEE